MHPQSTRPALTPDFRPAHLRPHSQGRGMDAVGGGGRVETEHAPILQSGEDGEDLATRRLRALMVDKAVSAGETPPSVHRFKYFKKPGESAEGGIEHHVKKNNDGTYIKTARCLLVALACTKFNSNLEKARLYGTSLNQYKIAFRGKKHVKEKLLWVNDEIPVQEILKTAKWIVNPMGKKYICWNLVMALLIIYTITFMPYGMVFMNDDPKVSTMESYMNIFFGIDIFVNFCTAIFDEEGKPIISHKLIAIDYMKGFFFLDFVSSIPFNLFSDAASANKLLRVLKIPRLVRMFKLAKVIKLGDLYKGTSFSYFLKINGGLLKVVSLVLVTIMILHLAACVFAAVALMDEDSYLSTWVYR